MVKVSQILVFISFSCFTAIVNAESHAHIQIDNQANELIRAECQDHHNEIVGEVEVQSGRTKGMSIYNNGNIHCKALNQNNETIRRKSFNLAKSNNYTWRITLAKKHRHIKVVNNTAGEISVKCHDRQNNVVGNSDSILGYKKENINIKGYGKIHCEAFDHHGKKILDGTFNFKSNGKGYNFYDWVITRN